MTLQSLSKKIKLEFANWRAWLAVLVVFIVTRIAIFYSFWEASKTRGGWQNFYSYAQAAPSVLMIIFHDYCDWHPPLYYIFTSIILTVFKNQWFVYIAQNLLAALCLWLAYKITRLFFSEKISFVVVFLSAIEPLWAWHNFMFASENLVVPLLLAAFYYLLLFFKEYFLPSASGSVKKVKVKWVYFSAIYFGLAALTRPNTLYLPLFLSILLIIFFVFKRRYFFTKYFRGLSLKKLFLALIIFNAIVFVVILPWMVRNKIVYDRFTLANILAINPYIASVTSLVAAKEKIPFEQALTQVFAQAQRDIGNNVGYIGDCNVFSRADFKKQLDYFRAKTAQYLLADWPLYLQIHIVKTAPFFVQSGYLDMWNQYYGVYSKPDMTGAFLRGDFGAIKQFFSQINLPILIYIFGSLFWTVCSLCIVVALVYSYFKDKRKFVFFLISTAIIVYSALVVSPFISVRYRLHANILFFIPLVYLVAELVPFIRAKWRKRKILAR